MYCIACAAVGLRIMGRSGASRTLAQLRVAGDPAEDRVRGPGRDGRQATVRGAPRRTGVPTSVQLRRRRRSAAAVVPLGVPPSAARDRLPSRDTVRSHSRQLRTLI